MFSIFYNVWQNLEGVIGEYIDIDFALWLSWLLTPLIITFLLPFAIGLLLYISVLILYIYKLHRHRLRDVYGSDWIIAARHVLAVIWDAHGWLWHGYEVVGFENIPQDGPVLFIYYHGALPVDLYYFVAKMLLYNSKMIHIVADRFLFKFPGMSILSEVCKIIPGTIQTCSGILKEGNMLAISPGGVYEAQFGDSYYRLMWKNRLGFAKVALDAKVTIIPFFTKNIREAFRTVNMGRRFWLRLYAVTRFPFAPNYGGFPVKLVTYVGKPIPYDPTLTPEQLRDKVAVALENLIQEHQKLPGGISRALLERVQKVQKVM